MGVNSKSWLSEGILITFIPIIGYLYAYRFEMSYASYFGIPTEIVSIDVVTIFISVGATLVILVPVIYFHGRLTEFRKRNQIIAFFDLSIWMTILMLFLAFWLKHFIIIIGMLGILCCFYALDLWRLFFNYRGKGTLIERIRMDNSFQEDQMKKTNSVLSRFSKVVGKETVLFMAYILMGYSLASFAGASHAMKRLSFPVMKNSPNSVVLRIYDDIVVSAELNEEKKEVSNAKYISKISEKGISLETRKIGPLKLEQ